jgi:hypothetical protein
MSKPKLINMNLIESVKRLAPVFEFAQSERSSLKYSQELGTLFSQPQYMKTKRFLSVRNALWSDEKNRFYLETIKH